MKILVFIKEVVDTRVPVEYDEAAGGLRMGWNAPLLNPGDRAAVKAALKIKEAFPGTRITLVHLGPVSGERIIREVYSLGCDEGLRIWDEDIENLEPRAKALIFERVARVWGFDLMFAGARSEDTGSGQLAVLLACRLRAPCITHVTAVEKLSKMRLAATRMLTGGYVERVESPVPCVISMEADEDPDPYASLPALFTAAERKIDCLDLARIGISRQSILAESCLTCGPLRFPVPRARFTPAPDSSLPAFERREGLRMGPVSKREGRITAGDEESVVKEIFRSLLAGGWLHHLRKHD